ncbi:MAG: tRNA preQ1(34) S-adenosylmethionine ribosyltransferase-isomerase QueA [Clostridiales bacterium]|nr:tRNA preQ1(34) S-adenosylmethionine ribosyltransferase-isomerase QueA [Clostridiales bacterium]
MNRTDFYYDLPKELIAQKPVEPRDSSRLLTYDRASDRVEHRRFGELPKILKRGDLLVINNTRVLPVKVSGKKLDTGAEISFLLHKRIDKDTWETLCRPAKRAKVGSRLRFSGDLVGEVIAEGEEGARTVRFEYDGVFEEILTRIGDMPLPHYIHGELKDKERYQTVYAKENGSAAAPTAGLHFTERLMTELKECGVEFAEVLLHVGLGTFLPVKTDEITQHKMHSEYYCLTESAAQKINNAKEEGRRVIAVGTTSVRVLESCAGVDGKVKAGSGETNIFIYPPYKFKAVDALITNFHLPESTLIMLVSAFVGREKTLELYQTAVDEKYRFFSFGDACFFQ